MYQFDTSSMPSGFTWPNRMMTSSRIRFVSGSSRVSISCNAAISACGGTVSVACRPPSIQMTALPSAASAFASVSLTPSALASFRAISR